jgi:hypothetical protein
MRYLLDTDWIINLLAGKKDTADYIQRFDPEDIGISLVTVAELYESAFAWGMFGMCVYLVHGINTFISRT